MKMKWNIAFAAIALLGLGCAKDGLGSNTPTTAIQAANAVPGTLEGAPVEAPYPLGLPSAIKGRPIYQANCASCHGTYWTAQEKLDIAVSKPETMDRLKEEGRLPGNPLEKAKNGPDFYSRDWRFRRTPSDLYNLIAYGSDRLVSDGHGGFVPEKDKKTGAFLGKVHPGPDGTLGKGWKESLKEKRGGLLVAPNDPLPVWHAVYYVWSRSIAGAGPQRYKESWDVYGQNCNVCHGTIGKGDGPLSATLNPQPFNFHNRKAMAEQTDEFLFWRISEGGQFKKIPESIQKTMSRTALGLYVHQWSAMPAWKGVLTEEQRWLAVDGVRLKSYEQD
jgi:mono/diheme cytochrome c family protein